MTPQGWKQGYIFDAQFIQVIICSIRINFISFTYKRSYKDQFRYGNIFWNSKSFRLFIVDRSYIVRTTFLNELFAKFSLIRPWCFSPEMKSLFTCDTFAFLFTLREISFALTSFLVSFSLLMAVRPSQQGAVCTRSRVRLIKFDI